VPGGAPRASLRAADRPVPRGPWFAPAACRTFRGAIQIPTRLTETDSDHLIHDIAARFQAPLGRNFGIGVEGRLYGRNSHYDLYPNVHRWVPQARAYLSYDLNSLSADIRNLTARPASKR
jgi:hypothetical protein